MQLFTAGRRDLVELAPRLEQWLRHADSRFSSAKLLSFRGANDSAGQANETYLLTLAGVYGVVGELPLILRTSSASEHAYFPHCSVEKQYRVMTALSCNTNLPVPNCFLYQTPGDMFGAPYFLMDRIDGDIPADNPRYTVEGVIAKAGPVRQREFWDNTMQCLVEVARVDWRAADLDFLDWPDAQRSRIGQHLDYLESYYAWAIVGLPDEFPQATWIMQWLRDHAPESEPAGLLWGDARPGNIIYHDSTPVGLLDWELARIGNPIADLAYFLMMDYLFHTADHITGNHTIPRLGGFPDHQSAIATYGLETGLPTGDFDYYAVFNGYKILAIMQRVIRILVNKGLVSAEAAGALQQHENIAGWMQSAIRKFA